jgi:flavin-dependent dehydrogenase
VEVKTDVAIIGAGPAGSTLAALLAQRGVRALLIERDAFPRDKVCGEFLSYDALPILDRLDITPELDRHAAPSITRCRVVGRKTNYEFELPRAARGVSRMLLDDLLFRRALSLGAEDRSGWTATRVTSTQVDIERDGEKATVSAKAIVGAWGRWGRFDTQLGRGFIRDQRHRNFGFKRHYRSRDSSVLDTIELYSFRRGYLGVSPVEGGITNICGLVHSTRLSGLRGKWDAFVSSIRAEEKPLERLYAAHEPAQDQFLSSEPVIFRARSAVERGIVMIGDASGVIDPLTGNGMAMAIQSALLAAPTVASLLVTADRRTAEDAYRAAHHQFFASRIRWSRQVAKLLSHPALLESAIRLVRNPKPGHVFLASTRASAEDVDQIASAWF